MSELSSAQFLLRRINELSNTFPPPQPPSSRKHEVFKTEDFSDIDKHAESAPKNLLTGGVENLLDYLRRPHFTTQLQLLRAIYSWLGSQQLVETVYNRDDVAVDSLYSFLKTVTENQVDVCQLFQYICLEAGLPCNIILGINKLVYDFPVGDLDARDNAVWTAIHVDGSWRFVAVSSAFTGVATPSVPAGCMLIEDSGDAKRERSDEADVKGTQHKANDFFFLTDPDVFIYLFLPASSEDSAWQLLEEPWSQKKFLTEPKLYVNYFQLTWRLSDRGKQTSRKVATKGKCSVTFVKPKGSGYLKYRLYFDQRRSKETMPEDLQLSRYILTNNDNIEFTQALVTRLPVNGLYLLDIMDEREFKLCIISIKATHVKGQHEFPPGANIFGPDKAAVDMGLVDVSREEGLLVVREGEKIRMRFRSRRSLEVKAFLLHNNQLSEDLAQRLTVNQKDDFVVIDVKVPYDNFNPEFAVQIKAREKDSDKEFVTVLNYLLTPDTELADTLGDRNERLLKELHSATADNDTDRLEMAIQKALLAGIEDSDEKILESLARLLEVHREAIQKAERGNDPDVLEAALSAAHQSKVSYALHRAPWFAKAEKRLISLRRIATMSKRVLKLSKTTMSEVHRINNPHPSVKSTLKAVLILLGNKPSDLKEWKSVQSRMRVQGREGVLHRIGHFQPDTVKSESLVKARQLLNTCSVEEIRGTSAACAALYDWCSSVLQMKDPDKSLQKAKTAFF